MATIHHKPYHRSTATATATSPYRFRRHSLDYSFLPSSTPFSTLKHSTPTTTFSASASTIQTSSPVSTTAFSLETLERYLAEQNFRQADEETRRLLIVLAGESAIKRGYVFFSEVQFISKEDLKAIDELWLKFSNGKFGYSVQKKIWVKVNEDFTSFFKKVSWMKKLDTDVEQFTYRSFPSEFIWELNPNNNNNNDNNNNNNKDNDGVTLVNGECPPEGHLPLTNALRGTQLLTMIFTHPAFDDGDDDDEENRMENGKENDEIVMEEVDNSKKKSKLASLRDKLFKPNYGF